MKNTVASISTSEAFDSSVSGTQTIQQKPVAAPATEKNSLLVEMRPLTKGMPQRMQVG